MTYHNHSARKRFWLQAFWHMRWPAVILCGPVLGVFMIALFFGLPDHLWFLAPVFFLFSVTLYTILVRGEAQRLRHLAEEHT